MSAESLGIGGLAGLARLTKGQSRSISPENPTGAKGAGGMSIDGPAANAARGLGQGWKVSPYVVIEPGTRHVLADIEGAGVIQQIWMTLARGRWRHAILRAHWDDQDQASIECPTGDFFACGWERFAQVSSLAVCVNPGRGFNCYWPMPFATRARFTLENLGPDPLVVFYQINYELNDVAPDAGRFHAQFRRINPLPYGEVVTVLDGVSGPGHYVGTYAAWGVNNSGWWGEGEIKFFLDGDGEFPTICGTGTEDYFGGAYNFDPGAIERDRTSAYQEFTTPYCGMPQVIRPDGVYASQQRFGLYRWHLTDPVRFERDLRVTLQALGWRTGKDRRYLPLQDDIATTAFWYQALPTAPFPPLPGVDALEVI
jgi:hypothetical protein